MTKPHEEEWKTGEGALSGALYVDGIWIGSFTNPERARLAVEAPEMVRALLGHVRYCDGCDGSGLTSIRAPPPAERQTVPCPACEHDRAVLRATGVPP